MLILRDATRNSVIDLGIESSKTKVVSLSQVQPTPREWCVWQSTTRMCVDKLFDGMLYKLCSNEGPLNLKSILKSIAHYSLFLLGKSYKKFMSYQKLAYNHVFKYAIIMKLTIATVINFMYYKNEKCHLYICMAH